MNAPQTLTRYEAARFALAEAHRVDEVKEIHNQAVALEAYAKQANDTELLQYATEIRLRAERRAGELLAAMPDTPRGRRPKELALDAQANSRPPTLAELKITDTQSAKWQKLAALPEEKFEVRVEHAKARVGDMATSAPGYSKAEYTGENEWFTPEPWLDLARQALGAIDLDPASHPIAQERVKAANFFTAADNGLEREWFGRVWLNPPYNRALLAPFVDKLVSEWASGRVEQAILLTHNYTDTAWFHTAARVSRAICFPRGRIHFLSPAGDECSPTQGQAFFYFGQDERRFCGTLAELGLIVGPL
jgi:phage N-6-adenine-methyltransferase